MESSNSFLRISLENLGFDVLVRTNFLDFEEYFTEQFFRACFNAKLRGKNGGGRDRLNPEIYAKKYEDDFRIIPQRCIDGTYKFSPYRERLSLKGRGKYPRVISIPGIRDRLVLSVLNCYLQSKLRNLVNSTPANQYISKIHNFILKSKNPVSFYKTDFSNFYDSVDKKKLISFLTNKKIHQNALRLVTDSINNPTLSDNESANNIAIGKFGIPQGLAISNILSALYLEEFDSFMKDKAQLYLRYVDDILLLNPNVDDPDKLIKEFIDDNGLNIKINQEKTKKGIIWNDELTFLGYNFKSGKVSLRKDNVTLFLNRMAKECTLFKKQFQNKELRPEFLKDDDTFVDVKIEQLNLSITGIKVNNRCFGWIHHYQQMNDLSVLSILDKTLRDKYLSFISKEKKSKLRSFKRCYFSIMGGETNKVVFDFDMIDDIKKIKAFMIKKGWLDDESAYSDDEIVNKYKTIIKKLQKKMELHIGRIS